MASEKVSPQQLSMFVPARELMGPGYQKANVEFGPDNQRLWETEELPRLREVVSRPHVGHPNDDYAPTPDGVPVHIEHEGASAASDEEAFYLEQSGTPQIDDGHHRLVRAYDRSPDTEVPVYHTDYENTQFGSQFQIDRADAIMRKWKR